MKRVLFSILALFFASSCSGQLFGRESGNVQEKATCPLITYTPLHTVRLHLSSEAPAKVAALVDGVLRYDECAGDRIVAAPPVADVDRSANILSLRVRHYGAYDKLPKTFSFEVIDRGDCSGVGQSYWAANDIPLEFQTRHPHGKECGSETFAQVEFIQ